MAHEGLLTFFPWDIEPPGQFLTLDIEYCTWANSASELINYPNQNLLVEGKAPWLDWKAKRRLTLRPQTNVVRRTRKKIGLVHQIDRTPQNYPIEGVIQYADGLLTLLDWMGNTLRDELWVVDLSPQPQLSANGSELFLDRRYDDCDVVFCGYYFIKITNDIAEWAWRYDLDEKVWGEGKLLKVPKLEGPMTLWNTDFCKRFYEKLITQIPFVKPEILLRAWINQGKVRISETTAKQMGWRVR